MAGAARRQIVRREKMTKSKTVTDHVEESTRLEQHIKDANALVIKMRKELECCRKTLEKLEAFCPNEIFTIATPYHLRDKLSDQSPMSKILNYQTKAINELLGDRA